MPGELFIEYQLAAQNTRPDEFVTMAAYGEYGPGYIGTRIATPKEAMRPESSRARRPRWKMC